MSAQSIVWTHPTTPDIRAARDEAARRAAETGEPWGLFYRGRDPESERWVDLWSAAPYSTPVELFRGPCEGYMPDGSAFSIVIGNYDDSGATRPDAEG